MIASRPLDDLYDPQNWIELKRAAMQGVCNAGIYLVRRRVDRCVCLEKKLPLKLIKSGAAYFEITTLRRLKHDNIVSYLDGYIYTKHGFDKASASLYMEYCSWGSLADEIKRRRGIVDKDGRMVEKLRWFEEREIVEVFSQLVNALAYIQTGLSDAINHPEEARNRSWVGIIHRDIKSENIFLRSNPNGSGRPIAVLGDFGAAALQEGYEGKIGKGVEPPGEWASPEWPKFSFASDVWLLGSVMQECCRLERCWNGQRAAVVGLGSRYPRHLNDAVANFMDMDPARRPRLHRWAPILKSYAQMARGRNGKL